MKKIRERRVTAPPTCYLEAYGVALHQAAPAAAPDLPLELGGEGFEMALDLGKPARTAGTRERERVEAGARGAGEYRCLECGYGIVTFSLVPACPMCHGADWEATRWSPFTTREESAEH